jgi:hypothetical protein
MTSEEKFFTIETIVALGATKKKNHNCKKFYRFEPGSKTRKYK